MPKVRTWKCAVECGTDWRRFKRAARLKFVKWTDNGGPAGVITFRSSKTLHQLLAIADDQHTCPDCHYIFETLHLEANYTGDRDRSSTYNYGQRPATPPPDLLTGDPSVEQIVAAFFDDAEPVVAPPPPPIAPEPETRDDPQLMMEAVKATIVAHLTDDELKKEMEKRGYGWTMPIELEHITRDDGGEGETKSNWEETPSYRPVFHYDGHI